MASSRRSSAMNTVEQPQRRDFSQLHPKDQQIKQTKKLCIEKNWQCRIHEALPEAIRPRIELRKGAKARVDDPEMEEEAWWNWSVELLKAIEELSSMTENELEYAQELLSIEVEQRQANPKSSQRKILEVLLGDVQRVVDEQKKRLAVMYTTDVMQDQGERMELQPAARSFGNPYHTLPAGSPSTSPYYSNPGQALPGSRYNNIGHIGSPYQPDVHSWLQSPLPDQLAALSSGNRSTTEHGRPHNDDANDLSGGSHGEIAAHLHSTELKARATKLRAEAVRMEAEAAQLEASARELREAMDAGNE